MSVFLRAVIRRDVRTFPAVFPFFNVRAERSFTFRNRSQDNATTGNFIIVDQNKTAGLCDFTSLIKGHGFHGLENTFPDFMTGHMVFFG